MYIDFISLLVQRQWSLITGALANVIDWLIDLLIVLSPMCHSSGEVKVSADSSNVIPTDDALSSDITSSASSTTVIPADTVSDVDNGQDGTTSSAADKNNNASGKTSYSNSGVLSG